MSNSTAKLMTIIIATLICAPANAGDITGSFTLGTGYLDNPLGITNDTAAGYLTQSLRLSTKLGGTKAGTKAGNKAGNGGATNAFKLGYEGNANQFGNDISLGSVRHGMGLEWFRTQRVAERDNRTNSISAGAQLSVRGYEDYYEVYDYREFYSYLSVRRHVGNQTLWSGFAAVRARHYGDLPEESYIEPHGQIKYQRFFASRTTLGLSTRYGVKTYNDSVASGMWDTLNLPSTSQVAARLNIAQGLSDRFSLRGRVDSRWTLSDFPYYVSDDIYDSPLLDNYAHEGWDVFAAAKWLAPAQIWTELGASRGEHDYGSMLFATTTTGETIPTTGETRSDVVLEYYLSLEKSLSGKALGPKLKLAAGWRDQDSSIETYTYAGVFASSTLSWRF